MSYGSCYTEWDVIRIRSFLHVYNALWGLSPHHWPLTLLLVIPEWISFIDIQILTP